MIMNRIFKLAELFRNIAISYSQLVIMAMSFTSKGMDAVKETIEVLKNEKYAPVRQNFERGVLLMYAAAAEFKLGFINVRKLALENPEDFRALSNFVVEVHDDFPELAIQIFDIPMKISEELKAEMEDHTPKMPAFIVSSGEYMDFVNADKKEITEQQFKAEIIKRYVDSPRLLLKVLQETKAHIESHGWAVLKVCGAPVVLWADSFDMDLPEDLAKAMSVHPEWPYERIINPKTVPDSIQNDKMEFLSELIGEEPIK